MCSNEERIYSNSIKFVSTGSNRAAIPCFAETPTRVNADMPTVLHIISEIVPRPAKEIISRSLLSRGWIHEIRKEGSRVASAK